MQITIENQTNFDIPINELDKIVTPLTNKEIELIVTNNETISLLNLEYRGIDKATDVLSFPLDNTIGIVPLGSIVISSDFVFAKANELGHTPVQEFQLLFIHGLLHLLGYDHEIDNGEMRAQEERIIKAYHLPTSLIVRTQI